MLMPLPARLHALVREYETLLAEEGRTGTDTPSPRLRDLAYTLCVSTGTRDIEQAFEAARTYLGTAAAAPADNTPARTTGYALGVPRRPIEDVRIRRTTADA
ncbi:DUF5133 domain-containing protein [Streptomyces sp. NPDC057806]|uniref:DUF5133 domain-containing protein n=1 Tax=Streptomyces sp. NPDC057806 TaxID=3346255 RepID=UPI00369EAE86